VTGTPGAGKSTFAKRLASVLPNSNLVELNDIVDEYKLYSKIDEMGSKVVKLGQLEEKAKEVIKEQGSVSNMIIVGHLVPEIKIKYDMIIVLRIGLKKLVERLEERGYQKEKTRENIVSESIDYCGIKSMEHCEETYEIETESEQKEVMDYIMDRAAGRQGKPPEIREISKFKELMDLIAEGNKYSL